MKIGILTYHRTLNYGACLQAIATRVLLENMGNEVYYVDYWPNYHLQGYKTFSFNKFLNLPSVGWKINYLLSTNNRRKRNKNFESFHCKYIIPYCKPISENFDVIFYGSDQIWRKQKVLNGYNPVYFGQNNFHTQRHIAFSASMGVLPGNDIDKDIIKGLLGNFEKISVRENDLYNLVKSFGFSNVSQTLDPTLLIDAQEWDKIIETQPSNREPYVLIYSIGRNDAFNMQSIKKYAVDRNLRIITLCGTPESKESDSFITTADPSEFLRLIKNASCIFTSSFHGLVFSLIYRKEVFASFTHNSNRAKTLLENIGLEERLIESNLEIPKLSEINYDNVAVKLRTLRTITLEFLTSAL